MKKPSIALLALAIASPAHAAPFSGYFVDFTDQWIGSACADGLLRYDPGPGSTWLPAFGQVLCTNALVTMGTRASDGHPVAWFDLEHTIQGPAVFFNDGGENLFWYDVGPFGLVPFDLYAPGNQGGAEAQQYTGISADLFGYAQPSGRPVRLALVAHYTVPNNPDGTGGAIGISATMGSNFTIALTALPQTTTPEPTTLVLAGLGMVGLVASHFRFWRADGRLN
jgi:hypothetical protein